MFKYEPTSQFSFARNAVRREKQCMKSRHLPCELATARMNSAELRANFLIDDLFAADELTLYYIDCERAIVGSACPKTKSIALDAPAELRADFFCERRELGVMNIGGRGKVIVDGVEYFLERCEFLYVGRGSKKIVFENTSEGSTYPEFYLLSYPAHKEYPTAKSAVKDANVLRLGEHKLANKRTINQAICEARIPSAQLVMGYTRLDEGSVWNTMPAHTHERRSEVYLYFDIDESQCVFHLMGRPDETRHLIMRNKQVALSPAWSIHSGCGTKAYAFCWGMGGENQRFDDMDEAKTKDLM